YMHLKAKYPDKLFDLEGIGKQTDMALFSKNFFSNVETVADSSVDANSNVDDLTVVAYENELPKPFARLNSLYLFWKYGKQLFGQEFANTSIEKELTGEYYINDLSNIQKPYCYNFSTYDIMIKGLPFVKKINSMPPKHLSSFCGQMIHFTSYASNQVMGAVGLADMLIVMSYYVKKELRENPSLENYIWRQVKQEIQSLIYSMNQPFRGGLQSGFYNISVYDEYFLDSMVNDYLFPDGSHLDKEIIRKLQDIYLDLMNETMEVSPITFPVTTACFCIDENKNILDQEFLKYITGKNKKWAFINIYAGESSTLSSCCRLRSDKNNEYLGYVNSFGSGGTQIGSFGVVTLNLPKIAIKSKGDKDKFFELLGENAEYAIKLNHVKRYVLQKRIDKHALPLYDYGFMDLQKQYATIGLNGIYECIELMTDSILEESGQQFCKEVLQFLNDINENADKKYKYAHNLEQTPSENSAIKLAQKDKILKVQNKYELYSNQFIPLIANADLLDRIKLQGMFDSGFSGGSIMHLNVDSPVTNTQDLIDMINLTVKMGCVYHAINYNLQKCENGHMSVGKKEVCDICGGRITDNYIRVVGFIVNVKNFHETRRNKDYAYRQFYNGSNIGGIK
ncbi:MAG: anaerobic ribonucleoside-triphosphate reductase, partial [Candidatus Pacebacteria bacterium]|nr:anaerobic ribonucleoside-triphosphate reductase [Candidatus Paceibacterota bacterium]